ncbi:hypothetical protein Pve01_14550 [Planomonospora venezuelensis]|nr:hypothetical protein Pve01_14550 [Planomonospora venezuelensis]
MGEVGGLGLVGPEALDALVRPARNQRFGDPVRPSDLTGLTCWNMLHMSDALPTCGNAEQTGQGEVWAQG